MYTYKPLDRKRKEIRLLTLEPGNGDDMLHCTLKYAFLDAPRPPHYETISHVCGDQTVRAVVHLDGSAVHVSATSDVALREERGHQVGMMYEIYTQTSHNLIYLGPDDGNMLEVQDAVEAILREMSAETRDYVDFTKVLFNPSGELIHSNVPLSIDVDRTGLVEFFRNPWFSRLWVVQEACLSRVSTCYSGRVHLPLISVLRVALWLRHKRSWLPKMSSSHYSSITDAAVMFDLADRTYGRCFSRHNTLSNFLNIFRYSRTSERRDQVYAILGLWQKLTRAAVLPPILRPDYTLMVHEVFTNAANASYRVPMCVTSPTNLSNTLEVAGVLIATVTGVSPATQPKLSVSALYTLMTSTEKMLRLTSHWKEHMSTDIEMRVGLVLSCGVISEDTRATEQEALRGYKIFKRYLENHNSFPPPGTDKKSSVSEKEKVAFRYYSAMRRHLRHRAIFHTEEGHLGLGPECTRPGDVIAILYGCRLPVVMRPLPDSGAYRFLGMSYLYGMMDGEAVRRHKEIGFEDDRFSIVQVGVIFPEAHCHSGFDMHAFTTELHHPQLGSHAFP